MKSKLFRWVAVTGMCAFGGCLSGLKNIVDPPLEDNCVSLTMGGETHEFCF